MPDTKRNREEKAKYSYLRKAVDFEEDQILEFSMCGLVIGLVD